MDCHLPLSVIALEGRASGALGIKAFAEIGRETAGG